MYDYREEVYKDVVQFISDEVNVEEWKDDLDGFSEWLNDRLWDNDSVTGNGSGSYTFSSADAKQYLFDGNGFEIFADCVDEFGISAQTTGEKLAAQDWEWFDVTIRCYLLGEAISRVIDEISEEFEGKEVEE